MAFNSYAITYSKMIQLEHRAASNYSVVVTRQDVETRWRQRHADVEFPLRVVSIKTAFI